MDQVNLGRSGLRVSKIGLGCNNFGWLIDDESSKSSVHRALDLGVDFFDTADYYGSPPGNSEKVLGRLLGDRRKDITVVTKFGIPLVGEPRFCTSRCFIINAIEGSLRRLNTDWIDVYMVHWPDPTTPIEETLRALDDIVRSGKARYIAMSNYAAWQVTEAHYVARELGSHGFIAAQNEYSLLVRDAEKELIPALKALDMVLLPYFPLASGMLTGKHRGRIVEGGESRLGKNLFNEATRLGTERNFALIEALSAFAQERDHTILDLSIAWLLANDRVPAVCPGATSPGQVENNVKAADWTLSAQDLRDLDTLLRDQDA